MKNDWELTLGIYPGILFGFRHYEQKDCIMYVLYLPLIDLCLTIYD